MARREQQELTREERRARMAGAKAALEAEPPPPPPPSMPLYKPGDQIILKARPGYWNYTFGPALYYRGPRSIDEVYHAGEPVVVVAQSIPFNELQKLEMSHVRGFVLEEGSAMDEELYNFLQTQKRAAVLGCQYACYFAREGGWVIVDGVQGMVCFNPSEATLDAFQKVRAKGPPKQEKMQAVMGLLGDMVNAAVEDREKRKEEGTYDDPHAHHLTPAQATKVQKEGPGFILQLLAGLPIKGAPGAEEAGYEDEAEDAAEAGAKGGERRPKSAAERRAARDAGRAGGAGHDHDHDHGPDAAKGAGGAGDGGDAGEAGDDPAMKLVGAALRKAMREKEQEEARRRRAEGG